jgi:hypothetical protein
MKKILKKIAIIILIIHLFSAIHFSLYFLGVKSYAIYWDYFGKVAVACFFLSIYLTPITFGLGLYFIIKNENRKLGILLLLFLVLSLFFLSKVGNEI